MGCNVKFQFSQLPTLQLALLMSSSIALLTGASIERSLPIQILKSLREKIVSKIRKIVLKFAKSKWFALILGLSSVYTGLGFLGIISGWSNTQSIFSTVTGVIFILFGITLMLNVFLKKKD